MLRHASIAFVIVAIPMLLVGWLVGLLPSSGPDPSSLVLALAPLYLVYLVPLTLLVLAVRHRRPGLVVGVAAFAIAVYAWVGAGIYLQLRDLRALEIAAQPRTSPGQGLIALPTARECDRLCVQLIASGRYNVAIPDNGGWWIWSRLQGSACETEKMTVSRVRFLHAGYSNMCMQHSTARDVPNALVLAEYRLAGKGVRDDDKDLYRDDDGIPVSGHPIANDGSGINRIAARLPGFIGTVYELSERRGGADTVVARRFSGEISAAADAIAFSLLPGPVAIGADGDRVAFYEAATGLALTPAGVAGPADARQIFDRAEQELMKADLAHDFAERDARIALAESFGRAAGDMAKVDPALVRERIERFLASGLPLLTHAGLLALYYEPERDLPFIERHLLALLERDDPVIVNITLRRIRGAFSRGDFNLADDPDIKRGIMELAFHDELFESGSKLARGGTAYLESLSYGTVEEPMRARVKAFLLEHEGISSEQCDALFRILATDAKLSESIAVLVALPAASFATCTGQLRWLRRPHGGPVSGYLDRQQIAALMTRARELDAEGLWSLWQGIRLTDQDKDRAAPAMLDLIAALRHGAGDKTLVLLDRMEREASN
jgi:hypothetical protein